MGIFKEMDNAEIEVKKIMLDALEKKKKEIEPLITQLSIEIDDLKSSIAHMEDNK